MDAIVEFPYGRYHRKQIRFCSDTRELLKFIYHASRPIRHSVRRRLHELGYVIEKEDVKRRYQLQTEYYFKDREKINLKATLVFTTCKQSKDKVFYAVQLYKVYGNRRIWLYTLNPPTDKVGSSVQLVGHITHRTHKGNPIDVLVPERKRE